MWYRLKNTLLALSFSVAAVVAVVGLAEPSGVAITAQAQAAGSRWQSLAELATARADERAAAQLALQFAAFALDAALKESLKAVEKTSTTERTPSAALRGIRMPFFSFAPRVPRNRES